MSDTHEVIHEYTLSDSQVMHVCRCGFAIAGPSDWVEKHMSQHRHPSGRRRD